MKDETFYKQLAERYTSKKASEDELIVFFELLKKGELDNYLSDAFLNADGLEEARAEPNSPEMPARVFRISRVWARIAIAASVTGIIVITTFLFSDNQRKNENQAPLTNHTPTLSPNQSVGSNRAVLTLADGSSILLDNAKEGQLAEQGALKIVKTDSNQLAYLGNTAISSTDAPGYNTLTTPRGGQFQVMLPDGTRAWLNAASSLRFPTVFSGNERIVELDGESYFEVTPNASMPFRVKMKSGADIKVLGTHFNVHAYSNEPIKTSLMEGSIRLQSENGSAILKPGQEATIIKSGELQVVDDADMEQAVAWKNGLFEFNRAHISTVMRQIERWYDVEVVYQGEIPNKEFVGKFSRSSALSEALEILELSNIRFKIEGKKITVMP